MFTPQAVDDLPGKNLVRRHHNSHDIHHGVHVIQPNSLSFGDFRPVVIKGSDDLNVVDIHPRPEWSGTGINLPHENRTPGQL